MVGTLCERNKTCSQTCDENIVGTYHRLHVVERDWLSQHHFIKRSDEKTCQSEAQKHPSDYKIIPKSHALEGHRTNQINKRRQRTIQQLAVIHSHACDPANELEVGEVILVTQARV